MKVLEGKLSNGNMAYKQSPHYKSNFDPHYVVIHYTEGPTAVGAIITLSEPKSKNRASAHFVVDLNGDITQMVGLGFTANHAGASHWAGLQGLSRYSFGIEIVNEGRLVKTKDPADQIVWKAPGSKRTYTGDEVIISTHKFDVKEYGWKTFPEEQLAKVHELTEFLVNQYKLADVLGHDEIAPRRKWDPGPAFPIEDFREELFHRREPLTFPGEKRR